MDGLSAADVGTGIIRMREAGSQWPPSAAEFRAMCKPPKREHAAMYASPALQLTHKLDDEARAKGRAAIAEAMKLALKA